MQITRKGYYTITGPDGLLLGTTTNFLPDGLIHAPGDPIQTTSRDEAYEHILADGRDGVFRIHCPDREVDVARADVTIIFSEGGEINAYPAGAAAAADASAPGVDIGIGQVPADVFPVGADALLSAGTTDGQGNDLSAEEADWENRITQPGVVWYHDFRSVDEVDAFRWSTALSPGGNNPDDLAGGRLVDTVELDTSDGITGGGCLVVSRPAGTNPASEGQTWWRQFSPLKGSATAADGRGSGKVEDDPGADGTIVALDWEPTSDATEDWDDGFYGHTDFHGGGSFDGTGFWLQMRIKNDARELNSGNDGGGKILIFNRAGVSNDARQLVVEASEKNNGVNMFSMNRSGSPPLEQDTPGGSNQPGNEQGFCDWPSLPGPCWSWSGGWDTYLFHMVPGLGTGDMVVQVWAALPGETSYTRIWEQDTVNVSFPEVGGEGYNAFNASCYLNKLTRTTEIEHKYDQFIFSKDPIVLPLSAPTDLEVRTRDLSDGEWFNSDDGHATLPIIPNSPRSANNSLTWQTRSGWFDPIRRRSHWIGEGYESSDGYEHHYHDDVTNTWVTANMTAVPDGPSHWRGGCFDDSTGRMFWQREATDSVYWYNPDSDAWAFHSTHSGSRPLADTSSSAWTTGFHPNLFGSGRPGLIHVNIWDVHAFEFTDYLNDPTAGSWSHLNSSHWGSGDPLKNTAKSGSATYIPDRDELMVTGREDGVGGVNCIVIHAGAGLLSNLANGNGLSIRTATPIEVAGNSGNNKCYICIHPRKRSRILIMSAANSATWYSDDGGQTWPSGPAHPFTAQLDDEGKMSVTSIPHHGVVMGMTDAPGNETKLTFWRPAI